ncbi:MAG TPA: 2-amino-4-ketopentanoate thiolase [Clostridiaceae bacterium]|nr:2-amino-4-ketopentanoate thiolase [Clostridiaceae bacterium]
MIKKGEWVQIHDIVLKPEERSPHLPEDTKKVPLEMWVKGFLNSDADLGDMVEITTITGRKVKGTLVEVNPTFKYGFGETFVPEVLKIGIDLRKIVGGGLNE